MTQTIEELFCEMVRIDSESGNEAPFLEFVSAWLEKELGAACELDDHGNLIAHLDAAGSDAPALFLAAHGDTVKPGVGIDPVVEDGVIRSAGDTILGADDKAGLAAIIEAIRTAARRPAVDIVVTRGEEIGLIGAKNLDTSKIRAKRGVVVDTDRLDAVILGGPTHATLDITVTGKAAHAAMPEGGVSAIRAAAHGITRFSEGKLDEESVANVGTIQGGLIRNGVPETVTIQAECRSLDHEKCERQAEAMRRAFEEAAAEMGATADVDVQFAYRATKVDEDAPLVQAARAAIASGGLEPKTEVILGGTDALVLTGRGLEAVVLGFGGQGAHSTDEEIAVDELAKAAEILRHLLERLADGLDAPETPS
ncbi:MAG: M20/M25/M40 family metallo-hydrolase [Candidatus Bipolaricaulota bacterium]|nr:MAG: M20/M25/M40 family metallo-hydrolase [Candidatus Bipolaricaulota bacterium]